MYKIFAGREDETPFTPPSAITSARHQSAGNRQAAREHARAAPQDRRGGVRRLGRNYLEEGFCVQRFGERPARQPEGDCMGRRDGFVQRDTQEEGEEEDKEGVLAS